eukprot:NODE_1347_length_2508_cov_34.150357.p1 GENE.NODE_1347_length_2508_cov_34.150357~~NODE_1347_length_2508_cov_34.150357.p1  ORF type:complete len:739 (-),score=222.94 NODE_1347_length_2508_cov_34.150357:291-2441(-)
MGCGSSKGKAGSAAASTAGTAANKEVDKKSAKKENADLVNTMDFLSSVPLFKRLPNDQKPILADACTQQDFKAGDVVIKQGDIGDEFFLIRTGNARVDVSDNNGVLTKVATLHANDYFGESALLRDDPRNATITAETPLSTLKITRDRFRELELNDKLQFANRKAVGCGGLRTVETKKPDAKTPAEVKEIEDALAKSEHLQAMVHLDTTRITNMVNVAWKEQVKQGVEVITEGDLQADYFYIVAEGEFEVLVAEEVNATSAEAHILHRGQSKVVTKISKGGCFGELALLYFVPRAATVKAKVDSAVWVIDRVNFKNILMKVSAEKIAEYVKMLSRVELLSSLLESERRALADALVEMHFTQGEIILAQGEPGSSFYIMYDGEVEVSIDGVVKNVCKGSLQRGATYCFGESALLNNENRSATVKVTSKTAKALTLDRDSFNFLLGSLKDIMAADQADRASKVRSKPGVPNPLDQAREKILRKDLVKIGLLGCGGFGTVELFEHKVTKSTYAMKGLSKGYVVKTGMQESVISEKNIMMMTNSPFIIKLFECYNGAQSLYFLMEPALGGELYATYNRKGFHGSERHARFYIAGVVFAFEHLHESASPMQIYSKVMQGIKKVTFPPKCQGVVGELIKALLMHEPAERLPMLRGGTKNIKEHKWYNQFDWAAMSRIEMDVPFKPKVSSKKDIANFSARKEDAPRQIEYKDDHSGWDATFAT